MSDLLTVEMLKRVAPVNVKKNISQSLVDTVNQLTETEDFREGYRNNILGYIGVMKDGKYRLSDYLNAVRFVSYRLMDDNIIQAYAKTFPDRYQSYLEKGTEPKHIQSIASMYAKGQLVVKVSDQSMTPFHIVNQDARQAALNKQVSIMNDPRASFKVQSDAANSILTHTKGPEETKLEVDINVAGEVSVVDELRKATRQFSDSQRTRIIDGDSTVTEMAHLPLRLGESDE